MKEFAAKVYNWQVAESFRPYGVFHTLFFIGGFFLAFFLAKAITTKNHVKIKLVFLCMGSVLLGTEIIKQLYMTYINGWVYNWYYFPFQFCSVPMYLCFAVQFFKVEKARFIYGLLQTYGFIGGFFALIYPADLLSTSIFISGHSMLWHVILMFLSMFTWASGIGLKSNKDFIKSAIFFLSLTVFALILNEIIESFAHTPIIFFMLSIRHISTMPLLNVVHRVCGWFVAALIYVVVFTIMAFLVYRLQQQTISKALKDLTPETDVPQEPVNAAGGE